MKIYLVRHSESIDDIKNCYGGTVDFDLTEDGKSKVKELNTIAIVTHGNVHKSIFKNILNVNKKIEKIEDVAITTVDYKEEKFSIIETKGIKLGENIH